MYHYMNNNNNKKKETKTYNCIVYDTSKILC